MALGVVRAIELMRGRAKWVDILMAFALVVLPHLFFKQCLEEATLYHLVDHAFADSPDNNFHVSRKLLCKSIKALFMDDSTLAHRYSCCLGNWAVFTR